MGTVSAGDNLRLNSFVGHCLWRVGTAGEVARYTVARGARRRACSKFIGGYRAGGRVVGRACRSLSPLSCLF